MLSDVNSNTDLNDILMFQLAQEFDFADGRHVESVFELPDFDLLNGNAFPRLRFMALKHKEINTWQRKGVKIDSPWYTTAYMPSPIFLSFFLYGYKK